MTAVACGVRETVLHGWSSGLRADWTAATLESRCFSDGEDESALLRHTRVKSTAAGALMNSELRNRRDTYMIRVSLSRETIAGMSTSLTVRHVDRARSRRNRPRLRVAVDRRLRHIRHSGAPVSERNSISAVL